MLGTRSDVPLSSQKRMSFNGPIFIKLTVTQQTVANMFCTGLYLDWKQNLKHTNTYFIFFIYDPNECMAFTAPILINLILTEQLYVKIFCTEFTQIHQEIWKVQVEIHWLLSVNYGWHWVAFHETLTRLTPL